MVPFFSFIPSASLIVYSFSISALLQDGATLLRQGNLPWPPPHALVLCIRPGPPAPLASGCSPRIPSTAWHRLGPSAWRNKGQIYVLSHDRVAIAYHGTCCHPSKCYDDHI
ncbi:hypothetical protein F5Y07DRAFT_370141 [Xylaria sp. FL0933]|nr:hypothetical protein F5Y07DRAFT_370141 [Xylaria sp. FL0933]